MYLWDGSGMGGKMKLYLKPKNNLWWVFPESIEILFNFWRKFGVLVKEKWGNNRKKKFCSEISGIAAWEVLWKSFGTLHVLKYLEVKLYVNY